MSDVAYTLLEALGQLIYEMECVVDECNADESLAVKECCTELHARIDEIHRIIGRHMQALGDDDGDDS